MVINEKIYKQKDFLKQIKDFDNEEFIVTKKKIKYLNLSCSFDIETTSTYVDNEKFSYCYLWQFGINGIITIGRTLQNFTNFLKKVSKVFKLNDNKKLIIYIHNLEFEFQFIRKYFKFKNCLCNGSRKVISIEIEDLNIILKCSYMLSGYNLESLARNLKDNKGYNKLNGFLDYSKIRHNKTKLTKNEILYSIYDIIIVMLYINEELEEYVKICNIPYTKTGKVRLMCRNKTRENFVKYRKLMKSLTLDLKTYNQLKRCYNGGHTHGNFKYINKVLNNVASYDFNSAYPFVMCAFKYPMSKFKEKEILTENEFDRFIKNYACLFDICFEELESNFENENILSKSKCFKIEDGLFNNGKIVYAKKLFTTLNEIEFLNIRKFYKWKNIKIANFKFAYKNYLPKEIIEIVLQLYQNKTELKGVEDKVIEYFNSKEKLNSMYGMCVTDILKVMVEYIEEWQVKEIDFEEEINNYNNSFNRFLYYPWGIWVSSYNRYNLFNIINNVNNDFVYSDTDSVKMLNYKNHIEFINSYNNYLFDNLKKMCDYYKIDINLTQPKTIKGLVKTLGQFEYEGIYNKFKFLGAKRYIYEEDNKVHLVCSGLNKKTCLPYLKDKCFKSKYNKNMLFKTHFKSDLNKNIIPLLKHDLRANSEVIDMFNDNLYIPKGYTGKMIHTYLDNELEFYIKDYQDKVVLCKSLSGIHLEDSDYSLQLEENFIKFLKLKGVIK